LIVGVLLAAAAATAEPGPGVPPGDPVAYVLLADKNAGDGFADLKHQDGYLACYTGIAMLDRGTDHPILVSQAYNTRLNRVVKIYLNWKLVAGFQIVDPKLAF
jgi:hypothetical protein